MRQRQQAFAGKAETGGGEYRAGIRRRRHGGVAAPDGGRGGALFQAVAQRQRSHRQAVRHVARQGFIKARSPPALAALRRRSQAQQRTAAARAPGKAFGIDRRAGAVERQRGAEQMGDI
jgi:hypothetical protein